MSFTKLKRNEISNYILDQIGKFGSDGTIDTMRTAKKFNTTTQTITRQIKRLEEMGRIIKLTKSGRKYQYELPEETYNFTAEIGKTSEDVIWSTLIKPIADSLPQTAFHNYNYAFTEIMNNAIEHSEGKSVEIFVAKTEVSVMTMITDDGIGIFDKIAKSLNLEEKRFAVLELAKGKFTTDPKSHTGEGIFFSSKAMDLFAIKSKGLVFAANIRYSEQIEEPSEYMLWGETDEKIGTTVILGIYNNHAKTLKEIFDNFTEFPEGYGFNATTVPVLLLEYGNDNPTFVSRSQAQRLLARFEKFENIILDFDGVKSIGQGFADEVFRVFLNNNPSIKINPINCNDEVGNMIKHVRASSK